MYYKIWKCRFYKKFIKPYNKFMKPYIFEDEESCEMANTIF